MKFAQDQNLTADRSPTMASIGNAPRKTGSSKSFWTANQFKEWQKAVRLSGQKAAAALGVSDNSVSNYRQRGCPKAIALACIAIYGRQEETVKPWEKAA